MGVEKIDFILTFTFCQLCKESHVETWVNWHSISDLFWLCFRAPCRLAPQAAAQLVRPLIRPWTWAIDIWKYVQHNYHNVPLCLFCNCSILISTVSFLICNWCRLVLQLVKDGHDWYCFECHAGGDVICCTTCHRVYHVSCLAQEEVLQEDVKNTFVCPVCKVICSKCVSIQSWFVSFSHVLIQVARSLDLV
jgi:hypothetical protein